MGVNVSMKWNAPLAAIAGRILNDGTKVFAANEWHRQINPFTPFETGNLRDVVKTLPEGNMGVIHYTSPYAHYIYKGISKNGKGLRYKTGGTSAMWDQAAKAAGRVPALCKSIEGYLGR